MNYKVKWIILKYCLINNIPFPNTLKEYHDVVLLNYNEVYILDRLEHRWWDLGISIKEFDLKLDGIFYIGHDSAWANRDLSLYDLGWLYDPSKLAQYETYLKVSVHYREI